MAYTFQELAKLKNDLVTSYGITTADAARVVGYCSQNNIDITSAALGPVFSELGITPTTAAGDLDIVAAAGPVPDGAKNAPQRKKSTQAHKRTITKEKTSPQCIQDITSDNTPNKPYNDQKTIIDTIPPAQALPATIGNTDIIDPDYSELLPPGLYDTITALIDNYCQQQYYKSN